MESNEAPFNTDPKAQLAHAPRQLVFPLNPKWIAAENFNDFFFLPKDSPKEEQKYRRRTGHYN